MRLPSNDPMFALLIVAHAPLASALAVAAAHAFPEQRERVAALDVTADEPEPEVGARLRALLDGFGDADVLVMTDVFGATPCRVVQSVAGDYPRMRIVAGVNVPMVWRILGNSDFPLDELVSRALSGATQAVMCVSPVPRQEQRSALPRHGQDGRHDQQ